MTKAITQNDSVIDIDISTMSFDSRKVRSGLIVATTATTESGEEIRGPLFFDESMVVETGCWPLLDGETIDNALVRVYQAHYDVWCDRVSKEARAEKEERERTYGPFRPMRKYPAAYHGMCNS